MKLSVIILNYKVPYHLLLCLQSVQKAIANLPAEIIVVDNCSEDESCQLVRQYFPEVILLENKKNEGFSKGNNRGVEVAKGKYICLLNPDTVVGEPLFENLLNFAETYPDLGVIGPKLIDGTGNFLPESKRNLPTPKVAFQKLFGNTKNYYATHINENETGKVMVLAGACMLMEKSRYQKVGGLDEAYFMYGEDIDLCYKFAQSGYQNYYFGKESIIHFKGESTIKDKTYLDRFYGAMQLFYQKHFRTGLAMEAMVKTGLYMAKLRNRFQLKKPQPISPEKEICYRVGEKNTPPQDDVLQQLNAVPISLGAISEQKISDALFIFDAENCSFQSIVQQMEFLKNNKNSFKIRPVNCNFMVGSDNSFQKGEVRFF